MHIRNRELSQFGSFVYITDDTKNIAITTTSTPYVGIGTTNPDRKLHVVGDIQIDGDLFYQGQLTLGNVDLQTTGIITASRFFSAVGQELKAFDSWAQNGNNVYRLVGNIGIGTENPQYSLEVLGDVNIFNDITASRFISTVSGTTILGTPPLSVQSQTLVANLNADFLRGGEPGGDINFGDIVTREHTQTLSNKTLTTPIISSSGAIFNGSTSGSTTLRASSIAGGTLTLPSNSGTLVGTGDVGVITPSMIANLSIVNSDIAIGANITYNKLNLSNSITNNDLAGGITNNKLVNSSISGVPLGSSLSFLLRGSYISGSNYNGSNAVTWDVDATSSATANKIVARDSSGNFSTNTISLVNDLNVPNGTVSTRSLSVGTGGGSISGSLSVSGIITAIGGFNIGIQSEGFNVTAGVVTALNFIGSGNTFSYDPLRKVIDISVRGGISTQWSSTSVGITTSVPVLIGSATSTGTLSQRLQVTGGAYVSGSVGIGSTNPQEKLDVQGGNGFVRIGEVYTGYNGITLNNSILDSNYNFISSSSDTGLYINRPTGSAIYFRMNNSDQMILNSSGNLLINTTSTTGTASQPLQISGGTYVSGSIGIGTTNPREKLDIIGTVRISGGISAGGTTGTVDQVLKSTGTGLQWGTVSGISGTGENYWASTTAGISTTARVGINITSPTSSLHVVGDTFITGVTTSLSGFVGNIIGNLNSSGISTAATISGTTATYTTGNFTTSNIATGVVTSISGANLSYSGVSTFTNGPVFIGSGTSTGTASQRLQVTGGAYVSGNLGVGSTNPTSKLSVVGDVLVSGVVTCTNVNTTSDINLKTNIKQIDNPTEKVLQLSGYTFDWIHDNTPSMGVVAQELEEILPQLVTKTNPKTVNYNGLIALLIESIKELSIEVKELKEQLNKNT